MLAPRREGNVLNQVGRPFAEIDSPYGVEAVHHMVPQHIALRNQNHGRLVIETGPVQQPFENLS